MGYNFTEERVKEIFNLSDFPIRSLHRIENQYWPQAVEYDEIRRDSPWWLVSTEFGLIRIGWRKRVIEIDWSDTGFKLEDPIDNSVTHSPTLVHAWSTGLAVHYLTQLYIRLGYLKIMKEREN